MEDNKLSEEEIEDIIKTKYNSKDNKTKEFIKKSLRIYGTIYDYSKSIYVTCDTKTTITCLKHDEDFEQTPYCHLKGKGCKSCKSEDLSTRQRMTTEEFIKKAKEIHKDKYDYSEVEYKNNHTKVKIFCNTCGNYFYQDPNSHLQGHGCPHCYKQVLRSGDIRRLTVEQFIERAEKLYPNNEYGYEKVSYVNNSTKVIIIDHLHNDEEFLVTPSDFLQGVQNPKYRYINSSLNRKFSTEEFIKRAKEIHEDDYDYSEVEYVNFHTKIKIYCPRCGEYFYQSPANHLSGAGCPHCTSYRMSRGERFISSWLNKNNIEYIHGQIVSGVEGRMLNLVKPDFQLTIDNINYWIEYNGELHYEYTPYFHSDIGVFEAQLKRDRNVREYCRNNDITLVEIPYIFNTFERVCDFLTQVLINKVDPNTIINYKELYELTEDISFGIDDLLL